MPNAIAVPYDGSSAIDRVLPVAAAFARAVEAPLRFIRVFELRAAGVGTVAGEAGVAVVPADHLGQPSQAAMAREMSLLMARAERECGVEATGELGEATDVASALLERIARLDPPLVVMATRGAGGLARALLGSVADAVVRESRAPVVLVPPGVEPPREAYAPRRVLVALDGAPEGEAMADRVAALVRGAGTELRLFSVVQPALVSGVLAPPALRDPAEASVARGDREVYLATVAARLRDAGHAASGRAEEGADPCREILAAARAEAVDLIAMATHGRRGVRRLARGSVADGVVREAEVPVMLLHPEGWIVPAGVPSPSP